MNAALGDLVAVLAVLCGAGAVAATVPELDGRKPKWSLLATAAIFALTAGALLYLVNRFLVADLSYQYVFFYTRNDLAWQWRLAGTWAGREGSLLLWTTALAAVAIAVAWMHGRREAGDEIEAKARAWTRLVLGVFLVAFLVAVAQQQTFAPTSPNLLAGRPTGNGLNPTLQSGYILIHPPMMFTAYALATLPAAAVIGHLISGTDRWSRVALAPSRLGWLLSTAAMGLGAMWAYYTLGFGGYWAWDPVEVANLLPWLALTVYLHAQLQHYRHGTYRAMGPFLGILPFLLTLFSTVSTRSGLWVSVHAFTDPTDTFDPDAAGRFLSILRLEPSLGFYVGTFVATLMAFLAVWARRLAIEHGTFSKTSRVTAAILAAGAAWALIAPASFLSALLELGARLPGHHVGYAMLGVTFAACIVASLPVLAQKDEPNPNPRRGLQRIDMRSLAGYSVLVLGLALLVLFLFHMAAVNGWTTSFYEARFPWLATPVLLGLIALQGHTHLGRERSLLVAAGAWIVAGLAAFLFPRHLGGAYLAVLAGALVAVSFDRTRRAGFAPGMSKRARQAATLLWLGALMDLLFWLNPPSTVGFGALTWHPVWPTQFVFGTASAVALWLATRNLLAAPRWPVTTHLLVGLLGGFWVAPLLAAGAWALHRPNAAGSNRLDVKQLARLRQVGVYGVHFAMAIALLGYASSTYFKQRGEGDIHSGGTLAVGAMQLGFNGADWTGQTPGGSADSIRPQFSVTDGGNARGNLTGTLHWEPQAQAHFPLPATLRSWSSDLFLAVEDVHVAAGAPCTTGHPDGVLVEAYKGSLPRRVCVGAPLDSARVNAVVLPGLGLLWLALALGIASMAAMMGSEPVSTPSSRRFRNR